MRDHELQAAIADFHRGPYGRLLDRSFVPTDPTILTYLVPRAQQGSEAATEQVYLGTAQLVYRIMVTYLDKWKTHLPATTDVSDVFASGLAGVARGIRDFDFDAGNAFSTYVTWWIRNGVQASIYDLAGAGAIRAKALIKGIAPDDPLVGSGVLSLDYDYDTPGQAGEAATRTMHEYVAAPLDEEFDVELVQQLLELLAAVDEHLPQIVDLIDRRHTLREVAKIVGITEPRVRELLEQAQVELADYA